MKLLPMLVLLFPIAASADTIYHCKAYSGGTLWSNRHCNTQNALVDRMANVPAGPSWDEQVKIAETQRAAANAQIAPDVTQSDQATRCAVLKMECDKIWSRYSNWRYQTAEVVGPDRQRTIAIQADQQRLGCAQQ